MGKKITSSTIRNCFCKAGFLNYPKKTGDSTTLVLFDGQQNLGYLSWLNHGNSKPDFQSYVNVGYNLTGYQFLTFEEIVESIRKSEETDVEDRRILHSWQKRSNSQTSRSQGLSNDIVKLCWTIWKCATTIFSYIYELRCFLNC